MPKSVEFETRPYLSAWSLLNEEERARRDELFREREDEQAMQRHLDRLSGELIAWGVSEDEVARAEAAESILSTRHLIDWVTELYKRKRDELIRSARAVFCSVNQHSWLPQLHGGFYDVVIFEEASMIPSFHVIDIMELSRAINPDVRFIISGDPKQLPPIIAHDAHRRRGDSVIWGHSPFEFFDVDSLDLISRHTELTTSTPLSSINFLDKQSRMPRQLGQAVSDVFYGGHLESTRSDGEYARVPSWPDASLIFIDRQDGPWLRCIKREEDRLIESDLKLIMPPSFNTDNTDRYEAILAILLATEALETDQEVLIITPFRNQHRMISAFAVKAGIADRCSVSTVHSAQGSEAPVVIYSTVSSGHSFLRNERASHLHTVALSRAQQQLIVIGDRLIRRNKHLKPFGSKWAKWKR